MKTSLLLIIVIFASLSINKTAPAQCPNPIDEAYEDLLVFLNDSHFQEYRGAINLTNVTESEIITLNNNQHSFACQAISQIHPFNQTRHVDEYPGPDKVTYYKIRDLFLMVKVNRRAHIVEHEDKMWLDLVPTAILVYNSEFELIHSNMLK